MFARREVSRIEGFSDAVFGFALTLLVVSLEVPADFRDLAKVLSGFLPFAITFAVVIWIWFEHYLFFRRFGPEDGRTVLLNAVLLFVVLFYVYPLKFVFSNLMPRVTFGGFERSAEGFADMTVDDARWLLSAYSAGFIAVFGVFALLYGHASRQADELGLDTLERFDVRAGIRRHQVSVVIGLISLVFAVALPPHLLWLSGTIFWLLGPAHALVGRRSGRARARLAAPPEPADTPAEG
ncbi:MAG: TMEM175 family protein [Vicinamibacterales bacterium]